MQRIWPVCLGRNRAEVPLEIFLYWTWSLLFGITSFLRAYTNAVPLITKLKQRDETDFKDWHFVQICFRKIVFLFLTQELITQADI